MVRTISIRAVILIIVGLQAFTIADPYKHTMYGEGNMVSGQIYRGEIRNLVTNDSAGPLNHQWLQTTAMVLGDSVTKGDRLSMIVDLVGVLRYSAYIDETNALGTVETRYPNWAFIINRAFMNYILGDPETKPFMLTMGVFHYKYNPDVKNLGEYLFRSMAYPNFVETPFDGAGASILGLKLSSLLLGGNLRQDLILSNEWQLYPLNDFSLAYVAGVKLGPFLDIGAGGQAFHLFSVREDFTTPDKNRLSNDVPGAWYYKTVQDSIAGVRTYYSFRGIKLMGRINAYPLAGSSEIKLPVLGTLFGGQDLKVYAEANVLGLQNFPVYYAGSGTDPKQFEFYNKLSERIPVTFGFNAPTNPVLAYGLYPIATFLTAKDKSMLKNMGNRLMWSAGSAITTAGMVALQNVFNLNVRPDVLSFELEYWSNRYPNSYSSVYQDFVPIPEWNYKAMDSTLAPTRWHWSVYTTKRMGDFYVKFQVAHDHTMVFVPTLHRFTPADNLMNAGYWWWTLKTGYSF